MYCCNCKKHVKANLVTGKNVYPHRPDLFKKYFYVCPFCGRFVGCHPNTTIPLGCIPTDQLKMFRIAVHKKMEYIIQNSKISKGRLYKQLSKMMGYEYHNGQTQSIAECEKALSKLDIIEKEKGVKNENLR